MEPLRQKYEWASDHPKMTSSLLARAKQPHFHDNRYYCYYCLLLLLGLPFEKC